MEDFFKEAGLMCDSTGDACCEFPVCVFSMSTHIKMLTCIISARACVTGQTRWRGEVGRGGRPLIPVWAFILPEPLKTVVLGWEKYTGETCSKPVSLVTILCQILSRLKSSYKLKDSRWEMVFAKLNESLSSRHRERHRLRWKRGACNLASLQRFIRDPSSPKNRKTWDLINRNCHSPLKAVQLAFKTFWWNVGLVHAVCCKLAIKSKNKKDENQESDKQLNLKGGLILILLILICTYILVDL